MSRVDIKKFILHEDKYESISNSGRGRDGQVKRAGLFGRNVTVTVGDQQLSLNRGSLIDFINHNKKNSTELDFEKHYFEWFDDPNSNDVALAKKFNEVMKKIQNESQANSTRSSEKSLNLPTFQQNRPKEPPAGYKKALKKAVNNINTPQARIESESPEKSLPGNLNEIYKSLIPEVKAKVVRQAILIGNPTNKDPTINRMAGTLLEEAKEEKKSLQYYLRAAEQGCTKSLDKAQNLYEKYHTDPKRLTQAETKHEKVSGEKRTEVLAQARKQNCSANWNKVGDFYQEHARFFLASKHYTYTAELGSHYALEKLENQELYSYSDSQLENIRRECKEAAKKNLEEMISGTYNPEAVDNALKLAKKFPEWGEENLALFAEVADMLSKEAKPNPTAEELHSAADVYKAANRREDAIEHYLKAARLGDTNALAEAKNLEAPKEEWQAAEADCQGFNHAEADSLIKKLEMFENRIDKNHEHREISLKAGEACEKVGRYEEALTFYLRAAGLGEEEGLNKARRLVSAE